jgi:hypothetical protein
MNELGKLLKKIRNDNNHLIIDMSNLLGIEPTDVIKISNGTKCMQSILVYIIIQAYELNREDTEKLKQYAKNSNNKILKKNINNL